MPDKTAVTDKPTAEKPATLPPPVAAKVPNETELSGTGPKPAGTPIEEAGVVKEVPEFFKIFDERIADLKKNGKTGIQTFIAFMEDYLVKMDPTRASEMTNQEGAKNQQALFRAIKTIIDKTKPEDFNRQWNMVISYFWRYRNGALGDRYIHRFASEWVRYDENLTAFQRIVNLCLVSANPDDRQHVKRTVDISKTVETGFSAEGKQNLLQFYKA